MRLYDGVPCSLVGRKPGDIDWMIVRENVEGEYSANGGALYECNKHWVATQVGIFARRGTDLILRYPFEFAQGREAKRLMPATRPNGIIYSIPDWDSQVAVMVKDYPEVAVDPYHVDILTANFVPCPVTSMLSLAATCSVTFFLTSNRPVRA